MLGLRWPMDNGAKEPSWPLDNGAKEPSSPKDLKRDFKVGHCSLDNNSFYTQNVGGMAVSITQNGRSLSLTGERELTSGSQGRTYLGRLDGEPVVIKQLNALSETARSQLIEQLKIEAQLERTFGACRDPRSSFTCFKGVVANDAFLAGIPIDPAFKYSMAGPKILLLYSFVEGKDLFDLITSGPIPRDHKSSIIRQLLTSVSQLHKSGIVHRDIKPENLMYDGASSSLKIIDFGLACTMTSWAGDTPGSPGFAAPELLLNTVTQETLAAADIFATGMTIIQLITQRSYLEIVAERFKEPYTDERSAMLKYMTRPRYYGGKVLDLVAMNFGDMAIETCEIFFSMIHPTPEMRPTAEFVLAEFSKMYPPGAAAGGAGGGAAAANPFATPVKAYKPAEASVPSPIHRSPVVPSIALPPAEIAAIAAEDPIEIEAMSPIAKIKEIIAPLSPTAVRALPFGGGARRRKVKTRKNRKMRRVRSRRL